MHEHYGIDLAEPGLLDRRSARWLQVRVLGLLAPTVHSRLRFAMYPPDLKKGESWL